MGGGSGGKGIIYEVGALLHALFCPKKGVIAEPFKAPLVCIYKQGRLNRNTKF